MSLLVNFFHAIYEVRIQTHKGESSLEARELETWHLYKAQGLRVFTGLPPSTLNQFLQHLSFSPKRRKTHQHTHVHSQMHTVLFFLFHHVTVDRSPHKEISQSLKLQSQLSGFISQWIQQLSAYECRKKLSLSSNQILLIVA